MARDPKAARRAVGAIRSRIGKLEGFPLTGRRTKVKGVRVVVELKHGYVITYRVSGEEVLVLDLRHGRRKRFRPKR